MTKVTTILGAAALAAGVVAGTPALAQTNATAAAPQPETRAQFIAQIQAKFKALDTNGDGSIEATEADAANAAAAARAEAEMDVKVESEFARLDSNGDKQLSLAEFKAMAPKAKPAPAAQSISRMDDNKDQKLSFAEFSGPRLKAFDGVDANKDGTLSVAEQQDAANGR